HRRRPPNGVTGEARPGAMRRIAFAGLHHLGRTLERLGTLCFYAAAGTLRRDDLKAAIHRRGTEERPRETERPTESGLMGWEEALYGRFLAPGDRVLVVGCGNGRDLLALLQRGLRADGLDLSPRCIATAREVLARHGLATGLSAGDIETTALDSRFDAVVLSWFSYGYIPGAAHRETVLRRVAAILCPEGRILLSYVPGPRAPRPPTRLARLVARATGSDWRPEDGDLLVAVGPDRFVLYEHRFLPGELEREAAAAGLRVIFHEPHDGLAVLGAP